MQFRASGRRPLRRELSPFDPWRWRRGRAHARPRAWSRTSIPAKAARPSNLEARSRGSPASRCFYSTTAARRRALALGRDRRGDALVEAISFSYGVWLIPGTRLGGRLFFVADDGATATSSGRSDGTGAGRQLVRDINPGDRSSITFRLTKVTTASSSSRLTTECMVTSSGGRTEPRRGRGSCGTCIGAASSANPGLRLTTSLATRSSSRPATAEHGTRAVALGRDRGTAPGSSSDIRHSPRVTPDELTTRPRWVRLLQCRRWRARPRALGRSTRHGDGHRSWSRTSTRAARIRAPTYLTRVGRRLFFGADDGRHGEELWRIGWHQARDEVGRGHPSSPAAGCLP